MILTELKLNTNKVPHKDLRKAGITRGRLRFIVIMIQILFELPFYCGRPSSLTRLTQEDEFRF